MEVANQIRQNATEYSDFVNSLHKWTKEAENAVKAEELDEVVAGNTQQFDAVHENSKLYKDIKQGNYYKKWDSFDVEKELENVDYSVQQPKKNDNFLKLKKALTLKEVGNEYFKKGLFKKALTEYTKSLSYDVNVATLTNRALAWLKLEMYSECINDSSEALKLDNKCIKGFWRRGIAKARLKDYKGGILDLDAALVLEPGNKTIRKDLQKVTSLTQSRLKKKWVRLIKRRILDLVRKECGCKFRKLGEKQKQILKR